MFDEVFFMLVWSVTSAVFFWVGTSYGRRRAAAEHRRHEASLERACELNDAITGGRTRRLRRTAPRIIDAEWRSIH